MKKTLRPREPFPEETEAAYVGYVRDWFRTTQRPPVSSVDLGVTIQRIMAEAGLRAARADFQLSDNPLHVLEGFVTARGGGVPVPDWIMDKFTVAVESVLASKGATSLDAALGLARKNGPRTRWTERDQREADLRLKWLIEKLLEEGHPLTNTRRAGTSTKRKPGAVDIVTEILGKDPDQADTVRQRFKKIKNLPSRFLPYSKPS